jgi:hypothetical protein
MPLVYNKLENPSLQFAILHKIGREYCERVVDGKKFKADSVSLIAGDGRFGFQSRRRKREVSSMVETVDGTGFKKSKKTACRPRKMPCRLVSSQTLQKLAADPEILARRDTEAKKTKRASRRNGAARKGRMKPIKLALNRTTGRRGGLTTTPRS